MSKLMVERAVLERALRALHTSADPGSEDAVKAIQNELSKPDLKPVARIERADTINGFAIAEIDGRLKWLQHGDLLYKGHAARS